MKNKIIRLLLLITTAMALSSCAYQYLPDDDPHGSHHTGLVQFYG